MKYVLANIQGRTLVWSAFMEKPLDMPRILHDPTDEDR
jgi:hypothetical protein